jgi:hypothetical protein
MSFKRAPKAGAKSPEDAFVQSAAYAPETPAAVSSTAMADLHVKLSASEMKALKRAALDGDTTVSALVRTLIAGYLAKR